jgi:DNA-binding PadR family transcriptional regulator
MPTDARTLLPLKPLVFEVLLALEDGHRHGWSLVRDIQQHSSVRVLPANFYRTLRSMVADGLIAETDPPKQERDTNVDAFERRRYFGLTPLGRDAARLEARRLQALVTDARTQRLLKSRKS